MIIAGGVLWTRNFRRLERLERAGLDVPGLALDRRGRVRLRSAAPIALPRGLGLGLALAF